MTLPWHQGLWQQLIARRRQDALPHALLLAGAPGLGKAHLAAALARSLVCETPDDSGRGCGRCRACRLHSAGTHPDLLCIAPPERGKALQVEQVRAITRFLSLTPQQAQGRVVTLLEADSMTLQAANALLKTLEEPPGAARLLLVSARPGRLPATLRSRCQRLLFTAPPLAQGLDWLRAQVTGRPDELSAALKLAGGAPLLARRYLEQDRLAHCDALLAQLEALAWGDATPERMAQALLKLALHDTLQWMYAWVADLLRIQAGGQTRHVKAQHQLGRLQTLAGAASPRGLFHLLARLETMSQPALNSLNAALVLEDLLITWQRCFGQGAPRT
ncbi:MAG TPA: DNA polymerase III subunit delta' [Gammaproteobacteria bacterium]|nr:DNA polymerase III subunit delta' [Gammaproteobacteria bacterium]